MNRLTTALLSRACRIFLTLAYPDGEDTIPEKKRLYLTIPAELPLEALLSPSGANDEICQVVKSDCGAVCGYAFRLGSVAFPHLKLRVTNYEHGAALVFAVDTHDAFPRDLTCPSHPEHERWTALQQTNRQLKEKIERAWEQEGLCTFNGLLKMGLENSPVAAPIA